MGGKVWSEEEERVFWKEIVPTSSKRLLHDRPRAQDAKGWEDLCEVMQQTMGERARRKYTALMLYEHFFQNTVLKRYSPNAAKYARAYLSRDAAAAGPTPSQRGRAAHAHRPHHGSDLGEHPESPAAPDDSNDPLQLALDAFQILARADRRSHQGSSHTPAGPGLGGFQSTVCYHAYAYGSACDDGVCRCAEVDLHAGTHAAGFAALDPRTAAQGLLQLPPAPLPAPQQRALLYPPAFLPLSPADTISSVSQTPSAGLLDMAGDSSSSSNGTPGPGQVRTAHHAQDFSGRYYGYASLQSPAIEYGHGHASQQKPEVVGQDPDTAGLSF